MVMHRLFHTVYLLCFVLCLSCGVKRRETTVQTDALHFRHDDSLRIRQRLHLNAAWQVEWREAILSAPDSSGCQHIQTIRQATARIRTADHQSSLVDAGRRDTLLRHATRQTELQQTTSPPTPFPLFLWMAGIVVLGGFAWKYKK